MNHEDYDVRYRDIIWDFFHGFLVIDCLSADREEVELLLAKLSEYGVIWGTGELADHPTHSLQRYLMHSLGHRQGVCCRCLSTSDFLSASRIHLPKEFYLSTASYFLRCAENISSDSFRVIPLDLSSIFA